MLYYLDLSSLSQTLEKLENKKSLAKFAVYQKFTNSLAVSVLLSVAWIGYELYFNAAWIIPALWALLAYVIMVVICILWAPPHKPTRFAYSEQTVDDLEEEGIPLSGSGVMVAGDSATKLEIKERKVSNTTEPHVLGQGGDLEEDKWG